MTDSKSPQSPASGTAPDVAAVAPCSAAFSEWSENRGVWPRLTHQEIFEAGWNRALLKIKAEADDKQRSFDGYSWDSGAGSSGYDRALYDVTDFANALLVLPNASDEPRPLGAVGSGRLLGAGGKSALENNKHNVLK